MVYRTENDFPTSKQAGECTFIRRDGVISPEQAGLFPTFDQNLAIERPKED